MNGIQFNWSINIGHIMNLLVVVVGGISFFVSLAFNIKAIAVRISRLEANINSNLLEFKTMLDKQTDILVAIARQDERIASMDRRISEHERR